MNKYVMGGGAVLVAILIALTEFFQWNEYYLQYVWAALVLIWGIMAFMEKKQAVM